MLLRAILLAATTRNSLCCYLVASFICHVDKLRGRLLSAPEPQEYLCISIRLCTRALLFFAVNFCWHLLCTLPIELSTPLESTHC